MRAPRYLRAFTLLEVLLASGLVAMLGGLVVYVLQAGSVLYAKNYSINHSHTGARNLLDRLTRDIHMSVELPQLVDSLGAKLSLQTQATPASGIRFRKYVAGPLRIPSPVAASARSLALALKSSDPVPQVGDLLAIPSSASNPLPHDLFIRISSVTGAGGLNPTVSFASPIGDALSPAKTSGNVALADSAAHVVRELAYIVAQGARGPELRHYPHAMSAGAHGLTAFQNPSNYMVLVADMSGCSQPFSEALGDRALSVTLKVTENRFGARLLNGDLKALQIGESARPHRIPYKTLGL
jgi:hypothetical protein